MNKKKLNKQIGKFISKYHGTILVKALNIDKWVRVRLEVTQ